MMYIINYMVYHLRAYGISPRLVAHTDLLSNFLKTKNIHHHEDVADNLQSESKMKPGMPDGQLQSEKLLQSGPHGKKYVNIPQN